jgi:predicted Zn-dependent peptidase
VLRGGAVADPGAKQGVASLTAELLGKGAAQRDAFAFADAVAEVGGSFSAEADLELISVTGEFLARDRALMVELLSDALMRPRLDAQQFDDLRARRIEFIKAAKDSDPQELLPVYGEVFLFGTHPYGRAVGGSEASLATLTRDDVLEYYHTQNGGDRLIVAVAGDFDLDEMTHRLGKAFGGWPKAPTPVTLAPRAERERGRRVLLVDSPGSVQTYFWIGNVGVAKRFPERPALDLVNTVFGGRFTSMLNTELRIKSGLSYGARSRFSRELEPGPFAISSFTQTATTVQAIDLAFETYARLKKDGLPADALASAKAYVLGQYPLALETGANWASVIADLEFYGLDRSYIDGYAAAISGVNAAATRKVVDEVFPPSDDLVMVLIGDAKALRSQIAKYGPAIEMPISTPSYSPPAP